MPRGQEEGAVTHLWDAWVQAEYCLEGMLENEFLGAAAQARSKCQGTCHFSREACLHLAAAAVAAPAAASSSQFLELLPA